MEVEVVSKFYWFYFFKAIIVLLFLGILTLFLEVELIVGDFYFNYIIILIIIILNVLTIVFVYIFLGGCKIITVGPSGIMVYYLLFRKQIIIPYDSITAISKPVYKIETLAYGIVVDSYMLIEYNNTSFTFKPDYYTNYTELRAAIYNYKYGFDRQRSQY